MGMNVGRRSWNTSSVDTEEWKYVPTGTNYPCSESPCIDGSTGIRLFSLEFTNMSQLVGGTTEG